MREFFKLLVATYKKWDADGATRMGAALAFYTVFSLSPILLLVVAVASRFFSPAAVRGELAHQLQNVIGSVAADAVQSILVSSARYASSASIIGLVVLVIGATGVWVELRSILNKIWEATPKAVNSIWAYVRDRIFSLAIVMSLGALLIASLIASASLTVIGEKFSKILPLPEPTLKFIAMGTSFTLVTMIILVLFKYVPQTRVRWKHALIGGILTSFLFTLGQYILGTYLGRSTVGSTFGAAGSVVLIMIWAYYSSLIFLFGAEFTSLLGKREAA